jgi:hypothetical protein
MNNKNTSTKISWNTHALITREALRSPWTSFLHEDTTVVPLEEFLIASQRELPKIFLWYQGLLAQKANGYAVPVTNCSKIITTADFVKAIRLKPDYCFPYVRILRRDELPPDCGHDQSRSGPPGGAHVSTSFGEHISMREVLSTFSDEPDWKMDQGLFSNGNYGYGPCPFGPKTGDGSQAPFHMTFLAESRLVYTLFPRIKRTFMEERVRVFFALADLAFKVSMPYWGWRFTAWATHYLQDLTQPYHARALPIPLLPLLIRLIKERGFESFAERNKHLLINRHYLVECIVHFMMNEAHKRNLTLPTTLALIENGDNCSGKLSELMMESGKLAASLARRLDRVMERLMMDPNIKDPGYIMPLDESYYIEQTLPAAAQARPQAFDELSTVICTSLTQAGKVTRFSVRRVTT